MPLPDPKDVGLRFRPRGGGYEVLVVVAHEAFTAEGMDFKAGDVLIREGERLYGMDAHQFAQAFEPVNQLERAPGAPDAAASQPMILVPPDSTAPSSPALQAPGVVTQARHRVLMCSLNGGDYQAIRALDIRWVEVG